MEQLSQISWLDIHEASENSIPTDYFNEILSLLRVDDSDARWPDAFGEALYRWSREYLKKPINMLSLFSGGGGLDIAFHDAGFHAVQMIDLEPQCVETLAANTGETGKLGLTKPACIDIRNFDPPDDMNVDFIIGGPPCQTFSAAGRRAAGVLGLDDPRGKLFQEYVRILRKLQPKGFLFENVYGIIGAQGGKAWQEILETFASIGYTISYRILDAADYGVPQHRERLIIVGMRNAYFAFPRPTHGPDSRTHRPYYPSSLAIEGVTDEKPKTVGGRYGHLLKDIPPGLNYSFYTEEMGHPTPHFAWRSKFSDLLYKADPHMPVRTLKAQGGQYTGPFHWDNRPFSIGELKRLQTFPDDYKLIGGRLNAIQQIGNSVPPQLGRILAIAVLEQLFDSHFPVHLDYLSSQEELTFRQRKAALTTLYKARAKDAISKLYDLDEQVRGAVQHGVSRSSPEMEHVAHLGSNFQWVVRGEKQQDFYWNIIYSVRKTEQLIEFDLRDLDDEVKGICIEVEITPVRGWILPQKTIRLVVQKPSLLLLTAGWKALEYDIAEQHIKADLVQLNGYYQYEPRIKTKVLLWLAPIDETSSWRWKALQKVLQGEGIREIVSLQDLAASWNLTVEQTIDSLINLRTLGYEVRSEYTNGQIPSGCVLIPYAFPTLNPNSVQLRKVLFPPNFFTQRTQQQNPSQLMNSGLWTTAER